MCFARLARRPGGELRWLSDWQLLDAVAVSQATPGPFFTVATFIGYLLASWKGATLTTLGMFLPAFVYVGITSGFLPSFANRRWPAGFWVAWTRRRLRSWPSWVGNLGEPRSRLSQPRSSLRSARSCDMQKVVQLAGARRSSSRNPAALDGLELEQKIREPEQSCHGPRARARPRAPWRHLSTGVLSPRSAEACHFQARRRWRREFPSVPFPSPPTA